MCCVINMWKLLYRRQQLPELIALKTESKMTFREKEKLPSVENNFRTLKDNKRLKYKIKHSKANNEVSLCKGRQKPQLLFNKEKSKSDSDRQQHQPVACKHNAIDYKSKH